MSKIPEYNPDNPAAHLSKYAFTAENQPENRGRRKSVYTVLKDKGYSKDDIRTVLEEIFWYTEEEANSLCKNDDAPLIAKITAKAMLRSFKKGNMDLITKAFEYVLGKPDAKIAIRADQEKRLAEFMQEAQDIDYEEIAKKVGPPIQSEDHYQSMILDFKKQMEAGK